MKNLRYFLLCALLTGFVTTNMCVSAQTRRSSVNRATGLYGRRAGGGDLIGLQLNGLYYYGDAESLKTKATSESMAFSVIANYSQMFNQNFAWRVSLGGGMLRGDNTDAPKKNVDKSFVTGFLEPGVTIMYYPFTNAGFYLAAGVSVGLNFIDYQFNENKGKTFSALPMIPMEIGYNFDLKDNWLLGINFAVHQGVCDVPRANLDGWPLSSYSDKTGADKWADGYFQFGLTIAYRITR